MRDISHITIMVLTAALVLVTIASMSRSYIWWVRMWDFPRLAILATSILVLVAAFVLLQGPLRLACIAILLLVAGWQAWRIYPYTPLAKPEAALSDLDAAEEANQCFTVLTLNVYQFNIDYDRAAALIERIDPDMLLLVETNSDWAEALVPTLDSFEHKLIQAQENTYGLIFASKLDTSKAQVRFLVENDVPSVFAWLKTPGGREFHFIGLHPRPPQPGNDTEERDAEISIAARHAAKEELPVLAMGDFNDVAWSKTSQMFKRIGEYIDPRIGRGFYATFPARLPVFRWPLDHLFMTQDFTVRDMSVLADVGSDHLPVTATLCLAPAKGKRINEEPEPATADDRAESREIIDDMKAKQASQD